MRHAGDAGKLLVFLLHFCLAGGANGGEGGHVNRSAGKFGLGARILDDKPQDVFETVMARLVQEIGLGCGEKYAIDAATETAKASPAPSITNIEKNVWADGGAAWRN